jgi:hypothetical protein
MKRILLRDRGTFKAREVIIAVLETPPSGQGITYADMRKRDRIFDALESAKGQSYFDLEDADHAILKAILDTFQWATGKRELKAVLDDIAEAKSPEETRVLKVVEGEAG